MRLVLYLTLILSALSAHSQTTFAPTGAEWHHYHRDGYFHSYITGDTIISGKTCRKIKQETVVSPTSWAGTFPTLYTYASNDTVFVYNKYFSAFTPLYIFNVTDGDTITIPDLQSAVLSRFRIDSVRMVVYDTAMLKTVYLQNIETSMSGSSGPKLSTYGTIWQPLGAYAERIGNVQAGIYPNCMNCVIIPEDCGCIGQLNCYHDAAYEVKLISGPCEPPVSVGQIQKENSFSAYPIPADDLVTVEAPGDGLLTLIGPDGRTVVSQQVQKGAFSLTMKSIGAGYYLMKWNDNNGNRLYCRLVVTH
ncbi:MAG: hypothetical protein KF744_17270 [Taibaiella sp.]|nr:hypothetical protein [Taibaiella sp.]